MKKKLLSIVLILALALSCFTAVVFAADGSEESAVVGGKFNITQQQFRTERIAGESTNTSVNTPFKGIDFSGKSSRTFKFAVYNGTNSSADIGAGFGWASLYATDVKRNDSITDEENKDYYVFTGNCTRTGCSVNSKKYSIITLLIPSGVYWYNENGTKANVESHGSGLKKVDGSGVGFRINFGKDYTGSLYMICIASEGVTDEEVKQINSNLATLKMVGGGTATSINDWNEDEITKQMLVEKNKDFATQNGFYALNYQIKTGSAYYRRLFPQFNNISETGETILKSELTVYNNSDYGVQVNIYPQFLWKNNGNDNWTNLSNDTSLLSSEKLYLEAKTKHTFEVKIKVTDGKIMLANGMEKNITEDGKLFYRLDMAYKQADIDGINTILEDYDITVCNANGTKYVEFTDNPQKVYSLPENYSEASETLPVVRMFNGDFELNKTVRWTSMGSGSFSTVENEEANTERGKYSLKYTAKGIYSSALYNVASAVANEKTADAEYKGKGAGLYRLTFDVKADENAQGKYTARLQGDDGGKHMICDAQTNFTTEWTTNTVYFNVSESKLKTHYYDLHKDKNVKEHKLFLRFDGATGALANASSENPCTYYLDNVTIEKVEFDANVECSLTVSDSLAFNVYAPTSVTKMDVTFNGEKTTLTPVADNDKNKFTFSGITPEKMADKITFVCYQEVTSGKYVTKEYETSVKEYLTSLLGDDKAGQLAIDTLNYGAMSQVFVNYKTDNLANKDLDENSQKAYESLEKPASDYSQTGEGFAWASASLQLEDTVNIKFNIKESDYKEGMVVDVNGTELTDWKKSGDKMYVVYKGIKATKLGEKVTAKVMQGDEQVSKTLTYSVGTYVNRMWEKENINLLKSLVKYGNSAVEYSAK